MTRTIFRSITVALAMLAVAMPLSADCGCSVGLSGGSAGITCCNSIEQSNGTCTLYLYNDDGQLIGTYGVTSSFGQFLCN